MFMYGSHMFFLKAKFKVAYQVSYNIAISIVIPGLKVLMKAVYIFLVALISVLLAVTCVTIVIMARRPKKKMNRFKTRIRNNKIFCRTSDDIREQSLIMKAGKSMECIEDM